MTDKLSYKRRILTNDTLSDEHAYIAGMLLTLASGDPLAYRVSTWVAQEIFEIDETEWHACLDALTAAGLVVATWESPTRATITFCPGGATMTQIAWPPDGGIHIHLNLAPPEPAPKSAVPVIDQLRVKAIDGQLQRLNRWLAEHSRQDYEDSFSDTADAMIAAADRLRGQVARLSDPGALVERDKLRIELATAIAERDASDSLLATLADWLAVHGDDTDPRNEVDLAIILMESQSAEIKRLNAELAILRSDATATPHGNGKSSVAAAAAAIQAADLPEQYPPAIAAAMNAVAVPVEQAADVIAQEAATVQIADDPDPELSDYIIGLDAGRHTWRTIPKPVRWRLVRSVLRSIWTDGKLPTMDDFDKHAPAWMPTANACATTFGDGKWTVMCGKAIEP